MRIHFIGIAGSIMHNLAIALSLQWNSVSGSDYPIYEPAYSRLKKYWILPDSEWWEVDSITTDIDIVILWMTASIDNPQLVRAHELWLPIMTYPQFIASHTKDKKKVVIAWSHGKTTTTAMIMHILTQCNIDHDYLVWSMLSWFDVMVKLSEAPIIIIEWDEYPESRETMIPKCLVYWHDIWVLNWIERDHINVFPTFESYVDVFDAFVSSTPTQWKLFYTTEDSQVLSLMQTHKDFPPQQWYWVHDYKIIDWVWNLVRGNWQLVPLQVFWKHNMSNINAAIVVCRELWLKDDEMYNAVQSFCWADKRLTKVYENLESWIKVYRDFAHAPSKVRATLSAVTEAFPEYYIVACYEMHTYSSTSNDFLSQYQNTLDSADSACVYLSEKSFWHKWKTMLPASSIMDWFDSQDICVATNEDQLHAFLHTISLKHDKNIIYLLMSSWNFDWMDFTFLWE